MKVWMVAMLAAAGAFFLGVAMAIEVLVFLPMPELPPGAAIGWDPISFFQHSAWQFLAIPICSSTVIFTAVYTYLSRHPLPLN